ncbi:ATP-binding protein, partial [Arthrospira platensis SPKY1]|nr:ATP-binding protein [Arthrospira platensis SPKY1]
MKRSVPLRIALTGPESTGKTTLAKALAARFDTVWAPEYARTYLERLGRPYQYGDLEVIARGQREW